MSPMGKSNAVEEIRDDWPCGHRSLPLIEIDADRRTQEKSWIPRSPFGLVRHSCRWRYRRPINFARTVIRRLRFTLTSSLSRFGLSRCSFYCPAGGTPRALPLYARWDVYRFLSDFCSSSFLRRVYSGSVFCMRGLPFNRLLRYAVELSLGRMKPLALSTS